MPWFDGLDLDHVVVVSNSETAKQAYDVLIKQTVVGFDTESKPTFVKGEKSTGPHVVQFSTRKQAYVFLLHDPASRKTSAKLIQASTLKKVGFGLSEDVKRIHSKLHIQPRSVIDIETLFSARHYGSGVGVKVGVALVFRRRFRKSRKASTSNWAAPQLNERQLLYAANDAYAAIEVYHQLTK